MSWSSAVAGLLFGLSLIVAIGAQNTFVLRQGMRRQHVGAVVAVCTASDIVLIAAGVAGAGAALEGRAWLLTTVRYFGIAFLLGYAALALRRAVQTTPVDHEEARPSSRLGVVLGACLALTWLNPGVYLDTVVVLGTVAHSRGTSPWSFAIGAMLGSVLWFAGIGYGAQRLAPLLSRPGAVRALDASVAVVMVVTAARLLVS